MVMSFSSCDSGEKKENMENENKKNNQQQEEKDNESSYELLQKYNI